MAGSTLKLLNQTSAKNRFLHATWTKEALDYFAEEYRDPPPGHLQKTAVIADELGRDDRSFGMALEPADHGINGARPRPGIIVQQQKIFSIGDLGRAVAGFRHA